jgi:tRNA nucleotidyltransferase (CCA-adding enzyme)
MSDYMFMLESHLNTDQNRVLREVQSAAGEAGMRVFLTGGAMRDMLGAFPIRDLDFTVEGDALKLARTLGRKAGAKILASDSLRRSAELLFPGGVTAEIAMARQERYPRPGGRPEITPATIHEDLRCRDFTVNAIALSLNPSSRGLLIDPTNGVADIQHQELRAVTNYSLFDDPVRILRLIRFRARLGYAVEEKTQLQYQRVRAAGLESRIGPRKLADELRHIADDPAAAEVVRGLEAEGLLTLFCPALTGAKVNLQGLARLQKARQLVPFGADFRLDNLGLFLHVLTEKLAPKEKAALIRTVKLGRRDVELWRKLEGRAARLERQLKSPKLHKPSQLYLALAGAPGDQILFLLLYSSLRLVQDRIKNYLQKYLPLALEVTDEQVRARGVQPGTPAYAKAKEELIAARLNARPKRPPEPPPAPEKPPEPEPPGGQPPPLRKPLTRTVR